MNIICRVVIIKYSEKKEKEKRVRLRIRIMQDEPMSCTQTSTPNLLEVTSDVLKTPWSNICLKMIKLDLWQFQFSTSLNYNIKVLNVCKSINWNNVCTFHD